MQRKRIRRACVVCAVHPVLNILEQVPVLLNIFFGELNKLSAGNFLLGEGALVTVFFALQCSDPRVILHYIPVW